MIATLGFLRPRSLDDALALLSGTQESSCILAGGTALVPMFSHKAYAAPERIVYVGELDELKRIEIEGEMLVAGALVTLAQLAESSIAREDARALADAAQDLASPQVRNRGTLGGNLAAGRWGGDLAVPLLALDARVVLQRRGSTRRVDLGHVTLESGELLTSVEIPRRTASRYLSLSRRRAIAPPIVSVAVRLVRNGSRCDDIRIALGGVAPHAIRASGAEQLLTGAQNPLQNTQTIAEAVRREIAPHSNLHAPDWYRAEVAGVLTARALEAAWSNE